MNFVGAALSTVAIAATWLAVASLVAGCGALARRGLLRLADTPSPARVQRPDLWIGLAVLTAYLQLWSLVAAISWLCWLVPLAAGVAGLAPAVRLAQLKLPPVKVLVALAAGIGWLANRSLDAQSGYDLGLYHAAAVEYASKYAAIPGLGNLHDRFASGDAHFLVTALLGQLPGEGSGLRLANGLLLTMLFLDVAARVVSRSDSLAFRMSLLTIPAATATASLHSWRLTEPDLDAAVFVLVVVGGLYLVEAVEDRLAPAAVASVATFALAAVNRPLYWLLVLGALTIVVRRVSAPLAVATAPAALALGWAARQAILSGYPLYPLTVAPLPVDWRMPAAHVHEFDRWVRSWARAPGRNPDDVLGSSAWLGSWLRTELVAFDVLVPLLLLGAALVALGLRTRHRPPAPLVAVVVPAALTLIVWFVVAPDPRFVLGPLWLIPIALASWALPTRPSGPRAFLSWATVVVALGVGVTHVALRGVFLPITQRATTEKPPAVLPFRTASGLVIWRPPGGSDQCWGVELCTPSPSSALRQRGATIQSGFRH